MNVGEGKRNSQTSGTFSFPGGRRRPHLLLLLGFSAPTPIGHWSCFDSHAILDICGIARAVLSKRKCLLNKGSKPGSNCESKSHLVEVESPSQNAGWSRCWFFSADNVKHHSCNRDSLQRRKKHMSVHKYIHISLQMFWKYEA